MCNNNVISVYNLSKKFVDITAVNNINFSVRESEIFGLIGPDGAGKTTTIRIMSTLLKPDNGYVVINNFNTVSDYKKIRQFIGYMPQQFSLYLDLSVIENINFFANVYNTSIEENIDTIKDIYNHLAPFNDRLAAKLSGGMKQKLALCCALIHKPTILFLDEPTTGVDPISRKEFWEILKRLKHKGMTIVVSTPYMDEANLCDRIALMQNGNILSIDTPANIINQFNHKIFKIKSSNNYLLLNILKENENTFSVNPFGEYIHYIDKRIDICKDELLKYFTFQNVSIINIEIIPPSIEDCFINLMKNE